MRGTQEIRARWGQRGTSRVVWWWALICALVVGATVGPAAHAFAVIPPGQESRIRALLAPADLGTEVRDGISLQTIEIDEDVIEIGLYQGETRVGQLTLSPARGNPEDSESFSFSFEGDEAARPAAEQLMRAVREHDRGDIYIDDIDARPGGSDHTGGSSEAHRAEPGTDHDALDVPRRRAMSLDALAPWIAASCLLLILVVDPPRRAPNPPKTRRRSGHLVLAIVGTIAWAWYVWLASDPSLHYDTLVDYTLAMACDTGHCVPHHTSLEGFSQGFGFPKLISIFGSESLDPSNLQSAILAAAALSVVVVGLGSNHLYPGSGGYAAALAIPLVSSTAELPALWNPAIGPLPFALVWVFLAFSTPTGDATGAARWDPGAVPLVVAALAVVASAEAHPIAWALGGPVCMWAAWARSRGLRVAGLIAVFLGACLAMTQPMNLETLATRPPWILVLAGGTVVLGISIARRRVRLPTPVAFGLLSLVACLAIAVGGVVRGVDNDPRYYAVVVPGVCITAGMLVVHLRGMSRIPAPVRLVAAISAASLFVGLVISEYERLEAAQVRTGAGRDVRWSMTEAAAIARVLVDAGQTYDSLLAGLQGPNSTDIVVTAALLVPDPAPRPTHGVKLRLVVVRRPDLDALAEPLPPGWTVLDVALGWDRVVLLGELRDPTLRTEATTYVIGERSLTLCDADWADMMGGANRTRAAMVFPSIPRLVEFQETSEKGRSTIRVPIVPAGDEPRIFQLVAGDRTQWRFAETEGVDIETVPSGWRVRVTPQGGTTSELVLDAPATESLRIPLMEFRASERVILELLDRASARGGPDQ